MDARSAIGADFDALARQDARINAADAGELDQAVGFDRGHHHADFVHVGGDHHAEIGTLCAALRAVTLPKRVNLKIGDADRGWRR